MLTCCLHTIMHQFIVLLHVTKHGFILGLLQNRIRAPVCTDKNAESSGDRESETGPSKLKTINGVYLRHVSTLNWHNYSAFFHVLNMFTRDKLWELERPGWATESNVHITMVLGVTAIHFAVVRVFCVRYRIRVWYSRSIHSTRFCAKRCTSGLCLYL